MYVRRKVEAMNDRYSFRQKVLEDLVELEEDVRGDYRLGISVV